MFFQNPNLNPTLFCLCAPSRILRWGGVSSPFVVDVMGSGCEGEFVLCSLQVQTRSSRRAAAKRTTTFFLGIEILGFRAPLAGGCTRGAAP